MSSNDLPSYENLPSYEIRAIRYGRFEDRMRRQSHMNLDPSDDYPQPIDFFIYAITPTGGGEPILVDTGMTPELGARRNRPNEHRPRDVLAKLGIDPTEIQTTVLTHMHFDHGGTLGDFPNTVFHIQQAEIDSVSGTDMSHPHLSEHYEADHICDLVRANFEGRVVVHDGDVMLRPGITLHKVGGHAAGLQCLSVQTERGLVVLACDAVHFYDNLDTGTPFRIVGNLREMFDGYRLVVGLAPSRDHLIAGHDPSIMERWPHEAGFEGIVARLDLAPLA